MGTWDFPVNHVVPITKKFPPSQARAIDIQQSMEQALKRVMVPWSSWKIMWSIFDSTHQEDRKVNVNFYRKISPFYLFWGCYFFLQCLHAYMHAYIHAYIRMYVRTDVHSYIHTIIHYTFIHTCVCNCMYMYTYMERDRLIYIYSFLCSYNYKHSLYLYLYVYLYIRI